MSTIIVIESITPQVAVEFSADQGPQGAGGATGAAAKPASGSKGGSSNDFKFNDTDPAKMTAYDKYMNEFLGLTQE